MKTTALTLALLACSGSAFAQSAPAPGPWSVGVGAAIIDSPYAGEGSRVRPFPMISYEGERVFLRGISGGVHLYQSGGFTLDAIASARLHGFDIDDLGSAELRANGVDAALLRDRHDSLDAGLRASFGAGWGTLSLEAVHDIGDTSDGYEVSLDYRYMWRFDRSTLTANLGASRMSSGLTGYYFGILDEEIARGVIAYTPGAAVVPKIGLTTTRALGASQWTLIGAFEYQFLPDVLRDSPLLDAERNGAGRIVLGVSRRL